MFSTPFSELSSYEKISTISLFVTIALVVAIIVGFILTRKKSQLLLNNYSKIILGVIIGYSIALVVILMSLKLIEYKEAGYLEDMFSIKTLVGAINSPVQLYLYGVLLMIAITSIAIIFGKKTDNKVRSKSLVYASICIAMSFALSYIRFLELPQGGSITFASLLPLMIYSYIFGSRKGVIAGVIYGFLQFIQAPWFYHPVQFFLDYPIAFSAIGLTGLFREVGLFKNKRFIQFALGGVLAVIIRYLSHVVSGIFVFGSADPENYGAVAWSFLYNAFSLADMAICLLIGGFLFASKSFNGMMDPLIYATTGKSATEETKIRVIMPGEE